MRFLVTALALLAVIAPAAAQSAGDDPDEGEVRVYTNADLEALEPLPATVPAMPSATTPEEDWAFVQSVIDRHHERLDAERDRELERERIEIERLRAEPEPHYVLPWNFLPVGLRPCNGIGSLHCRPLDGPGIVGPERPAPPRPEAPAPASSPAEPRPGRPLPPMVPQVGRGAAPADR